MPIYEYACTACGERTEARQSFTDPPLDTCPICGGSLRKLYSPVGVVFKGSGFYSTDNSKSSSQSKSAEKGSKDTKDSSQGTKSKDSSSSSSESSTSSKKESSNK
ncbi:MAG TPA: FmdB family zinc ribbon protein [Actinomycetota bacterium]|nr:FmdB family zinc ribbon protein [Actinomycetota bacterium]